MIAGISGGIGSGKSVVSRILRSKGLRVYDCDAEAKRIMACSRGIKQRIRDEISAEVTDGESVPDKRKLAEIVFADEGMRRKLNAIVHSAVVEDVKRVSLKFPFLWVESAILAESGLADICDRIWRIETPEGKRIENILRRDGCNIHQAQQRLKAQEKEETLIKEYSFKMEIINNAPSSSLLQQIDNLLDGLNLNFLEITQYSR